MPNVPNSTCGHTRSQSTWTPNWESTAIPGQEQPAQRHVNGVMPSQRPGGISLWESGDGHGDTEDTVTSFPILLPTHSHSADDEETKP